MSREAWKILIKYYAGGKPICNCGEAYYSKHENGSFYCPDGCIANIFNTRDNIAELVIRDLNIKMEGGKK